MPQAGLYPAFTAPNVYVSSYQLLGINTSGQNRQKTSKGVRFSQNKVPCYTHTDCFFGDLPTGKYLRNL